MCAYVEVLAIAPTKATSDDIVALRQTGFGDAEIFEIVMVTAYYSLRCRMADGLGVEIDEPLKQHGALAAAFVYHAEPDRGAANRAQ